MPSRIIVIDDSPMLLDLTVKALRSAGFEAHGAADLASLDQHLAQGAAKLILVDVNMPEMFGDDVVEFLRTQKQVSSKLVLYSDVPETELQTRAKTSGADSYISKGKGLEFLVKEVATLVGEQPSSPAAPAAPAAESKSEEGAEEETKSAENKVGGPKKKRVLLVDDSEMITMVIKAELEAKGFEVHTADSADKATKIILKKQTRPDLVLLDVRMPNVNGEQLCRFIKGNSLFKGIKVLLCSSESNEELRRICREAGADGFVPKDLVMQKLSSVFG